MILIHERKNTALNFLKGGNPEFKFDEGIPFRNRERLQTFMDEIFPSISDVFSERIDYLTRPFLEMHSKIHTVDNGTLKVNQSGTLIEPRADGHETIFYHFSFQPPMMRRQRGIVIRFYMDEWVDVPVLLNLEQIGLMTSTDGEKDIEYSTGLDDEPGYFNKILNLSDFLSRGSSVTSLLISQGTCKEGNLEYKNATDFNIQIARPRMTAQNPDKVPIKKFNGSWISLN